ncbi:MAG TPA: A/G-specific adenine glycosylase [Nitrospiria bacterium]|nr:A/G-specific adenine glycosylase [Nitrospiria bacterium]
MRSKQSLSRQLLSWYAKCKRDLPWRRTRDPYKIWVSEIMLQQTQVTTVIPYYKRFLSSFPTVKVLAQASLQKVLKSWEGMGYYHRARNLHQAAQVVIEKWRGKTPSDPKQLETLPGIGRSTAGAIASIAFGKRAPILDGNVRRVLCRLFAIREGLRLPHVQERLWKLSEELLPIRRAGPFNQALMELGATVCLPQRPMCLLCPLRDQCEAQRLGLQDQIPIRSSTRPIPHHRIAVGIILKGRSLLMGPRPDRGLLAGLWGFPEIPASKTTQDKQALCQAFSDWTGFELDLVGLLKPVIHVYSHRHVTYLPYLFRCQGGTPSRYYPWQWVRWSQLPSYPFSVATRRMLDQVKAQRPSTSTEPLPLAAESPGLYRPYLP